MSLFLAELRKVWQPTVPAFTGRAGRRQPAAALDGHPPDRGAAVRRSLPHRRHAARRPDDGREGRVPAREIYRD